MEGKKENIIKRSLKRAIILIPCFLFPPLIFAYVYLNYKHGKNLNDFSKEFGPLSMLLIVYALLMLIAVIGGTIYSLYF